MDCLFVFRRNRSMQSPNFVLIMADQLAPHFTGAYGHPVVRTPSIDRLAERGCRFDAAYTPSPLCAPARFSMMSGQLPLRIGAYDNAAEFPSSVPTFAHYLRMMGYHTCLSGKMHFIGPDQLHGFDERLTTDVYPSDFAWTPDWLQAETRIGKWYHNMDSVVEAGVAATTFQLEYDDEAGFYAVRRLFDYARNAESQPFMLTAAFIHPHDPYVARRQWWDLYSADSIDMPAVGLGDCARDPHSERLISGCQIDTNPPSPDQVANARRAYYANTSYFDNWVGQIIDTLEQTGLDENTIVIVTSDHGDMLGERGLWYKMNYFEHSARVPLIVAGPGIAQSEVPDCCSLTDLLPTLVDLASRNGLKPPQLRVPSDGRSLRPLLEGSRGDGGTAISEYCAECTAYPMFMLREARHKYIHCESDPPLLFNIDDDPHELNNLADSPDHGEIAARFARQVAQRWDSASIRESAIASQQARFAVHEAAQNGARVSWDFQPHRDAAEQYVRNHHDWTVQAARSRFPQV